MSTPIIDDTMTLDQKLEAIEQAMAAAQASAQQSSAATDNAAPFDPAELMMCVGCQ